MEKGKVMKRAYELYANELVKGLAKEFDKEMTDDTVTLETMTPSAPVELYSLENFLGAFFMVAEVEGFSTALNNFSETFGDKVSFLKR